MPFSIVKFATLTLLITCCWQFALGQMKHQVLMSVGIQQHDTAFNNRIKRKMLTTVRQGNNIFFFGDSEWKINYSVTDISEQLDAQEHRLVFYCQQGVSPQSSAFATLQFDEWKEEHFVLMPAAAYNGNRFASRRLRYSPKLHDIKDIGAEKPMIISDIPRLSLPGYPSEIQERSGSMSTPSVGIYRKDSESYFWMLTDQGNQWGDHGISLNESADRSKMEMSIISPVVRTGTAYTMCDNQHASWDKPGDFKKGDSVVIRFRIYQGKASSLQSLFDIFFDIRTAISTTQPLVRRIPWSESMRILEKKFNEQNFVERHGYYSVGMRENFLQDWQPGWTGGMISTLPLLSEGADQTQKNVLRNFNWIFPNGISPSGFFWDAGRNGTEWLGGDIRNQHTKNWHLVRKSGDALWYIFKQFQLMRQMDIMIQPIWKEGARKVSDAFVQLWRKHHQLGQFVDSYTGDIIVGGSSSGAIVPAALIRASEYFGDTSYQRIATEIGNYLYSNFTKRGITCGGPGDALQNPDSESAAAMIESYVSLFESTRDSSWLTRAGEAARQFATWVVSYDYSYPDTSAFGKLGIRTRGSVYANTQNKHAAPGICTASGQGLLKLYQYTGDKRYLNLLVEITHGLTQYLPHPSLRFGDAPIGWVSERINMTDWEGAGSIGYILPISTWAETSLMLTYAELPGIVIDSKNNIARALDQFEIKPIQKKGSITGYKLTNKTLFKADVKIEIWSENQQGFRQRIVHFSAGEEIIIDVNGEIIQ